MSDDRAAMTAHFISTLPALLEKFGADPEKLTNLVSIPQYMDLDLYTTQRQEAVTIHSTISTLYISYSGAFLTSIILGLGNFLQL